MLRAPAMAERLPKKKCVGCARPDEEGHEGSGEYRGKWFCRTCWAKWDREPESPPIDWDSCDDIGQLRSEVERLRLELMGAWTLRVSSPCNAAGERWSDMSSATRAWRYWHSWCPCCKRPLNVSVRRRPTDEGGRQSSCPTGPPSRSDCPPPSRRAYVSCLWGTNGRYALGALVLGYKLLQSRSPDLTGIDLVLLHTPDVPDSTVQMLREFWTLKEVDYVDAQRGLFFSSSRFDSVFTKLHVFGLVEYDKVVMVDLDVVILQCIDALFDEPPPAALHRSVMGNWPGYRIDGRSFFAAAQQDAEAQVYPYGQAGGINAGVMVLKPSRETFNDMIFEVTTPIHPERTPGAGPEQDYLSRYYAPHWTHISVRYNYQLHRVFHAIEGAARRAADGPLEEALLPERLRVGLADINVIHFSGHEKMWGRFFGAEAGDAQRPPTDGEFAERLLQEDSPDFYKAWFQKDATNDYWKTVGWRPGGNGWERITPHRDSPEDATIETEAPPIDEWLQLLRDAAERATKVWAADLRAMTEDDANDVPPLADLLERLRSGSCCGPNSDCSSSNSYCSSSSSSRSGHQLGGLVDYLWYEWTTSDEPKEVWSPAVVAAADGDNTYSVTFEQSGPWGTGARKVPKHRLRKREPINDVAALDG